MNLVTALRAFNRKERYLVVGWALGNTDFKPSDEFRTALARCCGIDSPSDPFVAIDYHLDWLYAALASAFGAAESDHPYLRPQADGCITGSQEDIDLIVAFTDPRGRSQIVLVEAKGYSQWEQVQLDHKAMRLRAILGDEDRTCQRSTLISCSLDLRDPGTALSTRLGRTGCRVRIACGS